MTLCIAAACKYEIGKKVRDAVVLGSDFMVEGTSKADIHDKLYWINDFTWPVLISGTISRAIELKEQYRQAFLREPSITRNDFLNLIYKPLRAQKHHIADEYVSGGWAFPMHTSASMAKNSSRVI